MDTWGVCDAQGFQEQGRGFATSTIDKTTMLLLSCSSLLLWSPLLPSPAPPCPTPLKWLGFGSDKGVPHRTPVSLHWKVLGSRLILTQSKERAVSQVTLSPPIWPSSATYFFHSLLRWIKIHRSVTVDKLSYLIFTCNIIINKLL